MNAPTLSYVFVTQRRQNYSLPVQQLKIFFIKSMIRMSSRLMKYYDLLPDNKPLCSVREREREREREWIWTLSVYLLQVIQHIGRGFMKIWTSEINHFIRILNVVHSWVDRISTPYCNPNRVLNYQNIIKQIWQKSNGLKISSFVAFNRIIVNKNQIWQFWMVNGTKYA